MKYVSTAILIAGGLWLVRSMQGYGGYTDASQYAIGVMVFAGVLHSIWGRPTAK